MWAVTSNQNEPFGQVGEGSQVMNEDDEEVFALIATDQKMSN